MRVSKVLMFPSPKQTDFIQVLQSYVQYEHACRALTVSLLFPPQQGAMFMQFQVTTMQPFVLKLLIPVNSAPLMHPYANG